MPTEPNNPISAPQPALEPELIRELEKVITLLRNTTFSSGTCDKKNLALVRLIENVTPAQWQAFALENGLEGWLGVFLDCDVTESVSYLLSLQERLAFQRDHDVLTDIGNRRLFDRVLQAEFERANRSYTDISLLMLDLDNFKQINDTYGHACGDMVLKRLGYILKNHVRQYDVSARYGGEEFAVILPATSCWTAVMLGNRLLEVFRNEKFVCDDAAFTMSFSGGAASLSLLEQDRKSADELIKNADEALYDAKKQGKDRISFLECSKLARERSSLVLSQEKQFLFSCLGSE